jgi:hypothetical protein
VELNDQADYFQLGGFKTKASRYFCKSFLIELGRSSCKVMIMDIYSSTIQSGGLRDVAVNLTV